jgi:fumarate hydratase class I
MAGVEFAFQDMLPLGADETTYRLVTTDGISTFEAGGRRFVQVEPEVLTLLTAEAMRDIAHFLRPGHLQQLRNILDDPEASPNDRFVALDLLKNACIAAGGVLPMCQDTGTAIVMGKKGQQVLTTGNDEESISRGVFDTYQTSNLRYSQMAPVTMWDEVNTKNNLPAQIEIYATPGEAYKLLFMAKGGGSANKSYLYQETKALLNPKRLLEFMDEKVRTLGTAACPPYHLAIVIGGTSAEYALKTAKYASARYLDSLPTSGPRVPRRRARTRDPADHPAHGHRRAVRRQVLLPRRARHTPSATRRVVPRGHRGLLQRRSAGARQDHGGGCVPRGARARPGSLPARDDRRPPLR